MSIASFDVIGIKTRTSNSEEMNGGGKISGLWNRFYGEQVANTIPDKQGQEVFAVYYDYESDFRGRFTLLVGMRVASGTKPPLGMEYITVPAQNYTHFPTEKGEMPGNIITTWKKIWDTTVKGDLKRKYSYDLEVYGEKAADPKSAVVDVYIALP